MLLAIDGTGTYFLNEFGNVRFISESGYEDCEIGGLRYFIKCVLKNPHEYEITPNFLSIMRGMYEYVTMWKEEFCELNIIKKVEV